MVTFCLRVDNRFLICSMGRHTIEPFPVLSPVVIVVVMVLRYSMHLDLCAENIIVVR